jgi:hypothetical protein
MPGRWAFLLAAFVLAAPAAQAKRWPKFTPEQIAARQREADGLRYSSSLSPDEARRRLSVNFERNCIYDGMAVHLGLEDILASYPHELVLERLRSERRKHCLFLPALQALRGEHPKETAALAFELLSSDEHPCPGPDVVRLLKGACAAPVRKTLASRYCACRKDMAERVGRSAAELEELKKQRPELSDPKLSPESRFVLGLYKGHAGTARWELDNLLAAMDEACPSAKTQEPACD